MLESKLEWVSVDLQFEKLFDVELETTLTLATMTYIETPNMYELHPMDECVLIH